MVDFDFDDAPASGGHSELTSEMDSFLSGDESAAMLSSGPSFSDKIEEARKMMSTGDFAGALSAFKDLVDNASPTDPAERELWEEAHFQIGACYYGAGQLKESMTELAMFVKSYPQSKFVKNAFLYTGYVFEKAGAKDKAAPYYKKSASIPPKDDVTVSAMKQTQIAGAVGVTLWQ